jgi:putative MFS transporter
VTSDRAITTTVIVASLGYFVDIFDLQLFNIVSRQSLEGIGITDAAEVARLDYSLFLWQMSGMLVGGLLWGILGDRKGRKNILFGSILMYSLANIANAFVTDVDQYAFVRFVAGLGLAGELGAAITLVSEVMSKERRGYGTMVIVTMGALGAVAAALLSRMQLSMAGLAHWQLMYLVGGGLGLLLLLMRMGTFESSMFDQVKAAAVQKGNFLMLFTDATRFRKYLACILIGLPVWFCIGVLIKFAVQFAAISGVQGEVTTGFAIMYAYIGLSVGDLLSGLLSQLLRSRRKVVLAYLVASVGISLIYFFVGGMTTGAFYFLCFLIGCGTGYWALFVTMASESFGTNIRATVTTTVPNFVRGALVPIILAFKAAEPLMGAVGAAIIVGGVCMALAVAGALMLPESFGRDLDYVE